MTIVIPRGRNFLVPSVSAACFYCTAPNTDNIRHNLLCHFSSYGNIPRGKNDVIRNFSYYTVYMFSTFVVKDCSIVAIVV